MQFNPRILKNKTQQVTIHRDNRSAYLGVITDPGGERMRAGRCYHLATNTHITFWGGRGEKHMQLLTTP